MSSNVTAEARSASSQVPAANGAKGLQANRQDYIDWLRVGAMFLLVFYHSGRLFDLENWHMKNPVLNSGINVFNRFLDIWHMPLFFLLAGASIWFALDRRTPLAFTKERVLRLMVPLLLGILIVVPPQVYLQRIHQGDFVGSFLAWYPNTFKGTYSMNNPATGNLSWHHLWFLIYLFVFSVILLPVFWYFKSSKRESLLGRIAAFISKPGAIFLPAIPLVVVNILLRPIYGWGTQSLINDWAEFFYYLLVVFYGFMLVSHSDILRQVKRYTGLSAAMAAVSTAFLASHNVLSIPGWLFLTLIPVACWCWLVSIIGVGSRVLNFSNRLLKYASDAVLPVYVVHQTLIVTFGFLLLNWNVGVAVKYPLVIAATFMSSLAIYEAARRTQVTRFLLGMRFKKEAKMLRPASQPVELTA